MTEAAARGLIASAVGNDQRARLAADRLAIKAGVVAVAEALFSIHLKRSAGLIARQKHDRANGASLEERRTRVLERLDAVIDDALPCLYHDGDADLRSALADARRLARRAAKHASPRRRAGRPTLARAASVARLRRLGATKREAEMIFSAIRGQEADNLPARDPGDNP